MKYVRGCTVLRPRPARTEPPAKPYHIWSSPRRLGLARPRSLRNSRSSAPLVHSKSGPCFLEQLSWSRRGAEDQRSKPVEAFFAGPSGGISRSRLLAFHYSALYTVCSDLTLDTFAAFAITAHPGHLILFRAERRAW